MLRIGICDDSADARDALRFALEKIIEEGREEIVYEFSSGSGAVRWLNNHPGEIDLLFLDVEMEGVNGMEAAGQIREFDSRLMIVFCTGYTDYVFDGYRVGALDYLIKPVDTARLSEVMRRVRERSEAERERSYTLKNTEGLFRFPLAEIPYFYSDKRKVILVYREKEYAFYGKLDEVEKELGESFVRIHQRYLVNPRLVEHIGGDFVTMGDKKLPISRALKENATVKLAKAMLQY